jgi:hypothetical protein
VQYTLGERTVVLVWARPGVAAAQVRLTGLEPGATYRIDGGAVASGATLAVSGLSVPFALAPDCDIVVVDRAPADG